MTTRPVRSIIDDQLDGLLEKMAAHVPATTIGQIGSKDL